MERTRKRMTLATVLSVSLILGTAVALTPPADAVIPYPRTDRVGGSDAVAISVNVSKRLWSGGEADAVVLARKDKFPDGLAASALAADHGGPVLFTSSSGLDAATKAELERVLDTPKTVFLMGGTVALSDAVKDQVEALGYETRRLGGLTRVETAAQAARVIGPGPGNSAIVVRAFGEAGKDNVQGWVDAISCGAVAATTATTTGAATPILLTDKKNDDIPQATRETLQEMGIQTASVCGGIAAVPQSHANAIAGMGIDVNRYAGDTRVTTAVDVARRLWGYQSTENRRYILVNGWGENFAYGIAASGLAAELQAPVLLANTGDPASYDAGACASPPTINYPTLCYLDDRDGAVAGLTAVGGTDLISDNTFIAAAEAGGLERDTQPPTVPQDIEVVDTPEDDGTHVTVSWSASTDNSGEAITYTVYTRNASDEPFTKSNASPGGSTKATSLAASGCTAGTPCEAAVIAADRFGNESAFSAVGEATPTDEAPGAPESAPNVQNQPGIVVGVSWVPGPADTAGYIVERADASSFSQCADSPIGVGGPAFEEIGRTQSRNATSFRDEDVTEGDDYCYRYRVFDTTDNTSEPSPVAGIQVTAVGDDTSPPAGTPSLYAVNFDQAQGLVGTGQTASRTSQDSIRVDTIVPAGAFENGETGHMRVFVDGTQRHDETFTATGNEQVVSADVAHEGDGGSTVAVTAKLADATGNVGATSAAWALEINGGPARPRITLVDGVNTDPLEHRDAKIPVVGGDTPRVNPHPPITIEGLSTGGVNSQRLVLYRNGTQVKNVCFDPDELAAMGGDVTYTDVPALEGNNNFVAALVSRQGSCGLGQEGTRSGDSNTVRYRLDFGAFGIISSVPTAGTFDPFGFPDRDDFTVTLNKDATSGSSLALRPLGGDNLTSTTNGADGDGNADVLTLGVATPLTAGHYELVVTATAAGDSSQSISQTIPFSAGIIDGVYVSAAIGEDENETNGVDEGRDLPPPPVPADADVTLVVTAEAPSGRYQAVVDDGSEDAIGDAITHTQGTEDRQGTSADVEQLQTDGIAWHYTECTPNASDETSCSNPQPGAHRSTDDPQSDGTLPAAPSADYGLRQDSGNAFRFDGPDGGGFEVYYRPTTTSDANTTFRVTNPQLIRSADGAPGSVDATAVQGGWTVRYYARDVVSGNESPLTTDGTLRRLTSISPTNSLLGTEGRLEADDTLVLTFANTTLASDLADNGTRDGGVQIFVDWDDAKLEVEPRFDLGNGSSAARTPTDPRSITITFGAGATVNGQSLPRDVQGTTAVHGGSSWRALNWAVDTTNGHAVLLTPSDAMAGAPNNPNSESNPF